jgi:hypothetical protein
MSPFPPLNVPGRGRSCRDLEDKHLAQCFSGFRFAQPSPTSSFAGTNCDFVFYFTEFARLLFRNILLVYATSRLRCLQIDAVGLRPSSNSIIEFLSEPLGCHQCISENGPHILLCAAEAAAKVESKNR